MKATEARELIAMIDQIRSSAQKLRSDVDDGRIEWCPAVCKRCRYCRAVDGLVQQLAELAGRVISTEAIRIGPARPAAKSRRGRAKVQ